MPLRSLYISGGAADEPKRLKQGNKAVGPDQPPASDQQFRSKTMIMSLRSSLDKREPVIRGPMVKKRKHRHVGGGAAVQQLIPESEERRAHEVKLWVRRRRERALEEEADDSSGML